MASFLLPHDGNIVPSLFLAVSVLISLSTALMVDVSLQLDVAKDDMAYRAPSALTSNIFDRADSSCPLKNYARCDIQSADALCCPKDTSCMVIASNTTAVCCPEGSSCSLILAITCDISQQDPSKHPTSPIQTTALNKSLEKCGDRCCPFGYLCNGSGQCKLDTNQDHYGYLVSDSTTSISSAATVTSATAISATDIPSTSNPASAFTTGPNSSTLVPSTKVTSTAAVETSADNKKESSPTGLIAACSIGGVCCAAAVGILVWLQWFRKKRAAQKPWTTPSQASEAYFDTPRSTRYLLARGPDDKLRMTPSTAGFEPPPISKAPRVSRRTMPISSPIELPATPVSMSCWIEGAEVEEPRLAYVLPARKIA